MVRELHAEVVPGESALKVLRNKILLTLKKADEKKKGLNSVEEEPEAEADRQAEQGQGLMNRNCWCAIS